MLECLILGDSIAVGTAQQKPECVSYAKSGINSTQWNKKYRDKNLNAHTIIISLGTNDYKELKTKEELEIMRNKIIASRVYWVLPVGNSNKSGVPLNYLQHIVKTVAHKNGDIVLPIRQVQSDRIHPTLAGYVDIANRIR